MIPALRPIVEAALKCNQIQSAPIWQEFAALSRWVASRQPQSVKRDRWNRPPREEPGLWSAWWVSPLIAPSPLWPAQIISNHPTGWLRFSGPHVVWPCWKWVDVSPPSRCEIMLAMLCRAALRYTTVCRHYSNLNSAVSNLLTFQQMLVRAAIFNFWREWERDCEGLNVETVQLTKCVSEKLSVWQKRQNSFESCHLQKMTCEAYDFRTL